MRAALAAVSAREKASVLSKATDLRERSGELAEAAALGGSGPSAMTPESLMKNSRRVPSASEATMRHAEGWSAPFSPVTRTMRVR